MPLTCLMEPGTPPACHMRTLPSSLPEPGAPHLAILDSGTACLLARPRKLGGRHLVLHSFNVKPDQGNAQWRGIGNISDHGNWLEVGLFICICFVRCEKAAVGRGKWRQAPQDWFLNTWRMQGAHCTHCRAGSRASHKILSHRLGVSCYGGSSGCLEVLRTIATRTCRAWVPCEAVHRMVHREGDVNHCEL